MDAVSYSHADKQKQRIEKFIENPDSNSGVLTQPRVIEAGETVTIPEGRMAVLPNLQIDGDLVIDGDVFIPSGATFGDLDTDKMDKDINGLVTKTTPVDADELVIADSTSLFSLKKLSFSNLSAWLKTIFTQKDYVIISGSATFSPTSNTVVMTGIGSLGLKIGDVISITGSTGNNKTFNVENIFGDGTGRVTDLNTIIVNYEHRGTSTPVPSKRLIAETSTISITLVTNPKEFEGLGLCIPVTTRTIGVTYTNNINRVLQAYVTGTSGVSFNVSMTIGNLTIYQSSASTTTNTGSNFMIEKDLTYSITGIMSMFQYSELR